MHSASHSRSCASSSDSDTATFEELHDLASDQRERNDTIRALGRLNFQGIERDLAQTIANNWSCRQNETLPTAIKPRVRSKNGKRVGHNQRDRARLPAAQWSKTLKEGLARLSALTWDDMVGAHERLTREVKRRQNMKHHSEHYARELLTGDVDTVTKRIEAAIKAGEYTRKKDLDARSDIPSAKQSTERDAFDFGDGNEVKQALVIPRFQKPQPSQKKGPFKIGGQVWNSREDMVAYIRSKIDNENREAGEDGEHGEDAD